MRSYMRGKEAKCTCPWWCVVHVCERKRSCVDHVIVQGCERVARFNNVACLLPPLLLLLLLVTETHQPHTDQRTSLSAPNTVNLYTSSEITTKFGLPLRSMTEAIASISARVKTLPVGLCGLCVAGTGCM